MAGPCGAATFVSAIFLVFGMGASPEMARVHTGWIIAGVAYDKPGRNFSGMNLIRDSVGREVNALKHKTPVSGRGFTSLPIPTLILRSFGNISPEANNNRGVNDHNTKISPQVIKVKIV